jgi:hypothetical protein
MIAIGSPSPIFAAGAYPIEIPWIPSWSRTGTELEGEG